MRKFLIVFLTVVMMISMSLLVACNKTGGDNGGTTDSNQSQSDTEGNTPTDGDKTSGNTGGANTDDEPVQGILTVAQVKSAIDESPNGVEVEFKGVVVGFDSMGYAHVGDSTGIIYVRAKHANLTKGAYVKIKGTGYVYKGSSNYAEYTRQIKDTRIEVEPVSGNAPGVKTAVTLSANDLKISSESADKAKSFHGNLATVTGTVSVGDTKFTYYLLDDQGNRMVAIHHYSLHFANSVENSINKFNALDGKKITITGVIYRLYTAESIWSLQYIYDTLQYTEVGGSGNEQPSICSVCGNAIINQADHAPLACGHTACSGGNHGICSTCGEYLCNGTNHAHASEWCSACGKQILPGETNHGIELDCGHYACMVDTTYGNHIKCAGCDGYMCNSADHNHEQTQTIADIKVLIDQYSDGVQVNIKGIVVGEDSQGYFHVADESGVIYVRAKASNYKVYQGDYVQIKGKGYVYRGSAANPEYTRQIASPNEYYQIEITKIQDGEIPFIKKPVILTASDLQTTQESQDIAKDFHGNLVTITGTVSVGSDKYTYYLLDDNGEKMVGIHHYSMGFYNTTDEYGNYFNALNGQKVTLTGVIYRYFTKENLWTFQYISTVLPTNPDGLVDGVKYEISADGTYAIVKHLACDGFRQEIVIQNEFNGLPVREIDAHSNWQLLKVTIPANVRVIGSGAFEYCLNLREIVIADGSELTTIRPDAFRNTRITQITLPSSLKEVGTRAFKDCEQLKKVYYNGTIDDWAQINFGPECANPMALASELYFGETLFNGNTISISSAVQTIGSYAFYNFKSVTEIILPGTLAQINYGAFEGCSNVVTITMPCAETNFESNGTNSQLGILFGGNAKIPTTLTTVTVIDSTKIPTCYFRGCKSITTVHLPSSITVIEEYAFYECKALSGIWLPSALTIIEGGAFLGCEELESINLPAGLTTIGNGAFRSSGLTEVKIPFETTSIGNGAFAYCANLKTLYIHSQVEEMGISSFESSITMVYFTGKSTWDEMREVNDYYRLIPGTKTYVYSYTLD